MSWRKDGARGKAAIAAILLLLAGGLLGVLVDRMWLLPRADATMPLTAQAMAERLNLSAADEARMAALLDTIHTEMTSATAQGADSLRTIARDAHLRIEAALPPHTRAEFRTWIDAHHRQLMVRMGGMRLHRPSHGH